MYYRNKIIDDANRIILYINGISYKDFINDIKLIDAILFRLIQLSENVKKLSNEFRNRYNRIKWNNIIGFRNKIVHDYGKTDYAIVYEVATNDIVYLKDVLIDYDKIDLIA